MKRSTRGLPDLGAELTSGFAGRLIQKKAGQICWSLNLNAHDREDLEQSFRLEVWRRAEAFDSGRGCWRAFVTTMLDRLTATEYRKRRATKLNVRSLSDEIDDQTSLGDLLSGQDGRRRRGVANDSERERIVREKLQWLRDQLDLDGQKITEMLLHLHVSEVARRLGIPRSTLVDRIHKLRRPLQTLGPNK
ncbi:RNA polymerase sigma factor [Thalassoglobus neptunius]|uniref:RNA polymerase sigma factor n=1 Tax=Thalassoglobus neptunius TaxID=1938619 RepID=A0A5C5UTQ4_9PLAN|nr:sigma factor [Thalassoglobus neptunius]TWT29814.1 RNA polymerase sigma factor [Thalassoglobus neptunius]